MFVINAIYFILNMLLSSLDKLPESNESVNKIRKHLSTV